MTFVGLENIAVIINNVGIDGGGGIGECEV